jgi:site-specific DNA-methyltransferase (adenine-specific)
MRIETIGDATLYLGDCRLTLLTVEADVVITDPPYGVTGHPWDVPVDSSEWMLAPAVCFATEPYATQLINTAPLALTQDLVWKKNTCITYQADKGPVRNHERVLVFGSPPYFPQKRYRSEHEMKRLNKKQRETYGTANPMSVLEFDAVNNRSSERVKHPSQKPLALMEWIILSYTAPGSLVLDPFMGSGTTGVACARHGRKFIGMESDPDFFGMAIIRIEAEQAKLELFA